MALSSSEVRITHVHTHMYSSFILHLRCILTHSHPKGKDTPMKSTRTFCAQVTEREYEEQKRNSMQCIAALLDNILSDETMSAKVKKQRLKMVCLDAVNLSCCFYYLTYIYTHVHCTL